MAQENERVNFKENFNYTLNKRVVALRQTINPKTGFTYSNNEIVNLLKDEGVSITPQGVSKKFINYKNRFK